VFLVICGRITDCDDYNDIGAWDEAVLVAIEDHA
jgi:hypothetical protein